MNRSCKQANRSSLVVQRRRTTNLSKRVRRHVLMTSVPIRISIHNEANGVTANSTRLGITPRHTVKVVEMTDLIACIARRFSPFSYCYSHRVLEIRSLQRNEEHLWVSRLVVSCSFSVYLSLSFSRLLFRGNSRWKDLLSFPGSLLFQRFWHLDR